MRDILKTRTLNHDSIQSQWASRHCSLCSTLKTENTTFWKMGLFLSSDYRKGTPILLDPLASANLTQISFRVVWLCFMFKHGSAHPILSAMKCVQQPQY
jgi:hypothetical protein